MKTLLIILLITIAAASCTNEPQSKPEPIKPTITKIASGGSSVSNLNMDRGWKMTIIDQNEILLTSNGDTLNLSFEDTNGLKELNPVVFANLY